MADQRQYVYKYPRPAVTTDMVVVAPGDNGELMVLLIERGGEPFKGCWAFPGGFLDMDEDAPECARRELKEETGLTVGQIMQVGAYADPKRDPRGRVITIAFVAYLNEVRAVHGGDDAARAKWWPAAALPELAFDHAKIMRDVLELIQPVNM